MPYATRKPHIADHRVLDLSAARRAFVFGDVHGRLDLLRAALAAVGFDGLAGDVAICVGDWMDRGPAGLTETRDFLATPGITWIRGNHEDILRNACHPGGRRTMDQSAEDLVRNGGMWIIDHVDMVRNAPDAEATAFADLLNDAPIALTVLTPGGARVGIVHAAVAADTWGDMVAALEGPDPAREDMAHHCMWDRVAADHAKALSKDGVRDRDWNVPGIDHVFYGHTIMREGPVRHGNQSWIDTGAYRTGNLTLVEIDPWIAA